MCHPRWRGRRKKCSDAVLPATGSAPSSPDSAPCRSSQVAVRWPEDRPRWSWKMRPVPRCDHRARPNQPTAADQEIRTFPCRSKDNPDFSPREHPWFEIASPTHPTQASGPAKSRRPDDEWLPPPAGRRRWPPPGPIRRRCRRWPVPRAPAVAETGIAGRALSPEQSS